MLSVTPIYAALLAITLVVLSVRVIMVRRKDGVALGDAGNSRLLRRIRVQANFTEYAPLGLLLLALMELQGQPPVAVHGIGFVLLLGRWLHAFGVSQDPEPFIARVSGMTLTLSALLGAAALLLARSVMAG